jgi:hypothetical protein
VAGIIDPGRSFVRVSAIESGGRTIWIADAHGYGKRFVVRADEMLTAFVELQRAIHELAVSLIVYFPPIGDALRKN